MKKIVGGFTLILILSGCLGIRSNIAIKANGTGTITMEYRISQAIQSIGRLDGNASSPTIPVSKEDFERSIIRIPGLKLLLFKTKTNDKDIIVTIKLRFDDLNTLVNFLDATGQRASIVQNESSNHLTLTLTDDHSIDPQLLTLAALASSGYMFEMHFSMPKNGTLTLVDSQGRTIEGLRGTSVSIPMPKLLSYKDGVQLELVW